MSNEVVPIGKQREEYGRRVAGRLSHSGPIYNRYGPADDARDRRLSGTNRYKTYRRLINEVAIIGAAYRFKSLLVTQAEWSFEGAMKQEAERLIRELKTNFNTVVDRMLGYHFYGLSVQEWVAAPGRGIVDIVPVPLTTLKTIKDGVFVQYGANFQEVPIPFDKCLYLVDEDEDGSPWGRGVLRQVDKRAFKLEELERLEGVNFLTSLQGIPIGRLPLGLMAEDDMSDEQIEEEERAFAELMRNRLRRPDQLFVLDSAQQSVPDPSLGTSGGRRIATGVYQYDLQLLTGPAGPLKENDRAITRLKTEIAQVLGTQQLLLGSDGTGSYALSADQTEIAQLELDSLLNTMAEAIYKQVIQPHWALMNRNPANAPYPVYSPVEVKRPLLDRIRAAIDLTGGLTSEDEAYHEIFAELNLTAPVREPREPEPPDDPNA